MDDLQKAKDRLEQQARQAEYDALQQKGQAERAATRLRDVGAQIGQLQEAIGGTEQRISAAKSQISDKDQEIAVLESQLRVIEEQQGSLVRQLYIMSVSHPDGLELFSSEPTAARQQREQEFGALKKSVAGLATRTRAQRDAVSLSRDDLNAKQRTLESLKAQQGEQVVGLSDIRQQQSDLKVNALAAEAALEARAQQARAQEDKVEQQILAELSAIIAARTKSVAINGGQSSGQRVRRGAVVGHEGSTGNSTGPHVHFECRKDNVAVDCQPYVNSGAVGYPISGFVITQRFGETANSYLYKGAPHTGTDLAGPYGTPVSAPADGTVILSKWYGGYGNAWAEQLDGGLVVLLGHMTGQ